VGILVSNDLQNKVPEVRSLRDGTLYDKFKLGQIGIYISEYSAHKWITKLNNYVLKFLASCTTRTEILEEKHTSLYTTRTSLSKKKPAILQM
jgi:hypothetical protein